MYICLFLVFVWTGVHSASGLTRLCTLEGEDRVFDVHEKKGGNVGLCDNQCNGAVTGWSNQAWHKLKRCSFLGQ